ncbi:DNA-3-methyladenine glycosylase [Tsukamurella pseudospumae]|uniref:Putative 3-methyladenine DNA glycosylase n=1 Tax=Tsukamurella pseudospumae TaxID=239498 RepID=A0A138AV46_9ACTN|nr:DNA-3-methyladenine glycosylase [Tsukamurella pseudospumae]KXP00696.1 3-methyladenine DNA glycosylase [Tsukamurella pseudospumae]KXP14292.1 3-methyladenine DNA glycosylase [Tsukamurella pseudospumae]
MTPERARERLSGHPLDAARLVLGSVLTVGDVRARIVEVEAYGSPADGPWPDPAAHTYPGPTPRNHVMFGPAGHLYVYLSYGIHTCINVTAGPDGTGSGVLMRAAEILDGAEHVRARRGVRDRDERLAAGPGRLGQALGISLADKGIDLLDPGSTVRLDLAARRGPVAVGPRIGISKAVDLPWRLWLEGHPSVSR